MKINYALILAASLSSGFVVQPAFSDEQPATPSPAIPAGADSNKLEAAPAPLIPIPNTPKKKTAVTAKKSGAAAAKKPHGTAAEPLKPAVPLTPGPAVARQDNVNVRGQAAINSEVVARLKKGEQVTVLEEITKKPKQDEPAKWAKIALPASTVAWVHGSYIDAATKTVKPKKLNIRSGPGENYSVIGNLEKGAAIKEIETKGDWIKIEPPAGAYAFVAAHLLLPAPPSAPATPMVAAVEPPKAPATPATPIVTPPEVAVVTPSAAPPVGAAPATPATPPVEPATTLAAPIPAPAPAVPAVEEKEEPLVKRVITREGIVKRSVSIQAPTYFVLESMDTGKTVNYLHSSSTNLMLNNFWNQRIMVTGEEQLDERWPNTPVIYVESVQPIQQ